jgi:Integrase core domain
VTTTLKVAHVRLCHSRMMFVRAYPRESQERVFDAHERAFAFFRGACARGIYDNMKTAVDTVFVGKDRQYNRRFLQMCSHHLVEPVACTPASGWEKGQVENQAGLSGSASLRPGRGSRLMTSSTPGCSTDAWSLRRLILTPSGRNGRSGRVRGGAAEARRLSGPVRRLPRAAGFGVEDLPRKQVYAACASATALRFDNNKYSVNASAVGRPVEIHAYADRVVIRQDGRPVAEHERSFGRGKTVYDPWHYVPVLARKPGALRNGAPFKERVLPGALERIRRKLAGSDDGDRQMVKILAAVLTDGLSEVEAACAQALSEGVHSADVILNILARRRDPGPAATIMTPANLRLVHTPVADCARYDALIGRSEERPSLTGYGNA